MAVSVAAWVNTDSPGLRRMIASLSPGLVSGLPPSPSIPALFVGVWFPSCASIVPSVSFSSFICPLSIIRVCHSARAPVPRAVAGQSRAVRRERGGPRRLSARNLPARQAVGQPRISPCSADRRHATGRVRQEEHPADACTGRRVGTARRGRSRAVRYG